MTHALSDLIGAALDGPARAPRGRPFRPGVSGNPAGRPRRAIASGGDRRRPFPMQPTELEQALAEPAPSPGAEGEAPVSLTRAVVTRLKQLALDDGNVAACRLLLQLASEAEAMAAERALAMVEDADAVSAAARDALLREQDLARDALAGLAEDAAELRGEADLEEIEFCALSLLDAIEVDEDGDVTAVKAWVAEAARERHGGQGPDLAEPRGPRAHAFDDLEPVEALHRLGVGRPGEVEGLAGWFIDAARARRPDRLTVAEEAMLALVRRDDGEDEPDWEARLAAVAARGGGDAGNPHAWAAG